MKLHRRGALGLLLAGTGALAAPAARAGSGVAPGVDGVAAVEVASVPIPAFSPREPERTRFGALTYRAGLTLTSGNSSFGGLSGLWRSADGRKLVAISDRASWFTASVDERGGRLAGLSYGFIAPVLGADGKPLSDTPAFDTEALAIAGPDAFVASERVHEIRRFDWAGGGIRARGMPIATPAAMKSLPANKSLEALAVAPAAHPLAGALIAIAEQARPGDDAPTRGWVVTGARQFAFDVARSQGFDVTDLTFLPGGDALLLERRFRVFGGVACRIRRLSPDVFQPGATIHGEVIFEADNSSVIDNMEGIATHRDPVTRETVVTLVSDDNFSPLQRTVLLEFALAS